MDLVKQVPAELARAGVGPRSSVVRSGRPAPTRQRQCRELIHVEDERDVPSPGIVAPEMSAVSDRCVRTRARGASCDQAARRRSASA